MANELQSGFDMDALASLSLDSSQLFMLQTAIKSIDSFFSLLSGQTSVSEDANRFQRMDSMNLNKPLARKNSISEQHRTTDGHNQGVSEAVLSVELMDTQEKYWCH